MPHPLAMVLPHSLAMQDRCHTIVSSPVAIKPTRSAGGGHYSKWSGGGGGGDSTHLAKSSRLTEQVYIFFLNCVVLKRTILSPL